MYSVLLAINGHPVAALTHHDKMQRLKVRSRSNLSMYEVSGQIPEGVRARRTQRVYIYIHCLHKDNKSIRLVSWV